MCWPPPRQVQADFWGLQCLLEHLLRSLEAQIQEAPAIHFHNGVTDPQPAISVYPATRLNALDHQAHVPSPTALLWNNMDAQWTSLIFEYNYGVPFLMAAP